MFRIVVDLMLMHGCFIIRTIDAQLIMYLHKLYVHMYCNNNCDGEDTLLT